MVPGQQELFADTEGSKRFAVSVKTAADSSTYASGIRKLKGDLGPF